MYYRDELCNLQVDPFVLARNEYGQEFFKLLSEEKYPKLVDLGLKISSMFGSTYRCESAFSIMKNIKNKYRSRLADHSLSSLLRMAITKIEVDIPSLVNNMTRPQCARSHSQNRVKAEPLSEHLFLLETDRWRPLRTRLSPVFTSGKLKEMFPLIVECAEHLKKYLDKIVENNEPVECRDLAAKFTTDVIGSCAFGIDMNALSDEDSEFRRMGRKLFTPSTQQLIRDTCRQFFPNIYRIFGHLMQPRDINKFFTKVIVDTMDYRVKHNILRPDFVNLLMEIKKNPHNLENIELTDSLLTAQAFIFFVAGFETSSSTIGHALYELAQNSHIQDKLRQEINETYTKNDRVLMYEQLKEMKYLDKVFRETLRKYPVLPMLMRQAAMDYTFKGTKISIPKDTKIWIPVYAIHHDPDIYPNPDSFDPERFNDDVVSSRHPMSYLPFGDGPRNCVGARFANIQSKIGLITILRHYRVDVCEKTTIPYRHDKRAFLITLKGGIFLKITKVVPMVS